MLSYSGAGVKNMSAHKKRIFGVIMTYNCAGFLEKTLELLPRELFDTIIITDDASTDDTLNVAKRLGIPAFTHPHGGYGGNLKFGLQKAVEMGADAAIEIHGDGQFASSIPEATHAQETGGRCIGMR